MFDRVEKMSHITICGNYGETNLRNMIHLDVKNENVDDFHYVDYLKENHSCDTLILRALDLNFNQSSQLEQFMLILSNVSDTLIYNGDKNKRISTNMMIKKKTKIQRLSYGFNEKCDIQARNMITSKNETSFDLMIFHELLGRFTFPVAGEENLYDLLACITYFYTKGASIIEIRTLFDAYQSNILFDEQGYLIEVSTLEIKEVQMQMEQLYKLDPLSPIYIINDSSINLRDLSLLPISTLVYQFDKATYESKKRELQNIRCNRLILHSR